MLGNLRAKFFDCTFYTTASDIVDRYNLIKIISYEHRTKRLEPTHVNDDNTNSSSAVETTSFVSQVLAYIWLRPWDRVFYTSTNILLLVDYLGSERDLIPPMCYNKSLILILGDSIQSQLHFGTKIMHILCCCFEVKIVS